MAFPLEKFVQQLEDSGILAGDTIKDFIPPKASPKDAEELARELVRKKKLTKFQAEEVSKGKGKSLVLGNYVLMEKIGAGGMGEVYKAEHRRMKRMVAIKLLPSAMTKDNAAIARFEREVTAAAKISHPNIVTAYDADQANGVHFLVMEMVDGQDLSALVKKNGPFSVVEAVNYILQAAKGLEAAHKKGIVHRDIKPANLLLDKEGVVKILDMGLARLSLDGDDAPQADLTSTGTIMGTVDYMAPEQALDTKAADARADIYALGCSLFYLLTGKATYDGDTLMKKLLAHRDQPIPTLRTIRPEVSEQLEAVFKKLVAKKVEDRYQSMGEVIVELERCTAGPMTSVTSQQPATTTFENGAFDFLKKPPEEPTIQAKPTATAIAGKTGGNKTLALIGAAVLIVMILAGIVVSLRINDGTLVVEIDQPGAMVQVLDSEGKVEISQKGDKGLVSISVDPGKHRLQIEKEGFTVFGQDFEMKSGGKTPIKAKLVPLELKPAMVGAKTVTVGDGTKKPLFFQTPGFEPWAKDVAAMPAEKQVEAVSKKLMELNPGFNGKEMHTIQDEVVIGLAILTDNVTDVSPVRALVGLSILDVHGSFQNNVWQGKLQSLSPLKGLSLTSLQIYGTQVSDLSPLQGMKLTDLNSGGTTVADLSPLQHMPLTMLYLTGQPVNDLSPLRGMPLKILAINATNVTELLPLKEMPLMTLLCQGTQVDDLSLLKGMPLKELYLDFNPDRDTALLRSIKTLETINGKPAAEFWKEVEAKMLVKAPLFFETPAFEPWRKEVAAMPAEKQVEAVSKKLVELNPGFDGVFLKPSRIENNAVTELYLTTNNLADISPIRALTEMRALTVYGTGFGAGKLSDLSPVSGMSIRNLVAFNNPLLSNISPLQGMPLTHLNVTHTAVSAAAVATLQKALPNCKIESDGSANASGAVRASSSATDYALDFSETSGFPIRSLVVTLDDPLTVELCVTPLSRPNGPSTNSPLCNIGPLHLKQYSKPSVSQNRWVCILEDANKQLTTLPFGDFQVGKPNRLAVVKTAHEIRLFVDGRLISTTKFTGPPKLDVLTTGIGMFKTLGDWRSYNGLIDEVRFSKVARYDQDYTPQTKLSADKDTLALYHFDEGNGDAIQDSSGNGHHGTLAGAKWVRVDGLYNITALTDTPAKPLTNINAPAFQQWVKDVQAMPAEQQVEAVSKKLVELNPGFDGKVTAGDGKNSPKVESGVVTEFGFVADHVTDISPVRALAGLKVLMCYGSENQRGRLSDLSPLEGMRLENLVCFFTQVSDLSPVRRMPLRGLVVYFSKVSDVASLEGLPLEHLDCSGLALASLAPLTGCKNLRTLIVKQSRVTPAEIAVLQKALPNCKIEWDDPSKAATQPPQ